MTQINGTNDRSPDMPNALVSAVASRAAQMAEMTAASVKAMDLVPDLRDLRLPAGFLLELGALAQIGVWEQQGFHRQPNVNLPSYAEASASLVERAARDPQAFFRIDSAVLMSRVIQVFVEHFAWSAQELLGADVLIGDVDEDAFIDQLAHFLLQHGAQVSNLLAIREDES